MSDYNWLDDALKRKTEKKKQMIEESPRRKLADLFDDDKHGLSKEPTVSPSVNRGFRPSFAKISYVNGEIVLQEPELNPNRPPPTDEEVEKILKSYKPVKYSLTKDEKGSPLVVEIPMEPPSPLSFSDIDSEDLEGPGTTVLIQPGENDLTPVKSTDFPHISDEVKEIKQPEIIKEKKEEPGVGSYANQVINVSPLTPFKGKKINLNQNITKGSNETSEIDDNSLLTNFKVFSPCSIDEDNLPIIEKKKFDKIILPADDSQDIYLSTTEKPLKKIHITFKKAAEKEEENENNPFGSFGKNLFRTTEDDWKRINKKF